MGGINKETMTKAERLIYLVNVLHSRRIVKVEEFSEECSVTGRTIYRDMESLARMGYPVYYDNGYRLARDGNSATSNLSVESMELICYSLANNPLSGDRYFQKQFGMIRQKLLAQSKRKRRPGVPALIQFARKRNGTKQKLDPETKIIGTFLKAAIEQRKLHITHKTNPGENGVYIPVSVNLCATGQNIIIVAGESDGLHEFKTSSIKSIRMTKDKFRKQSRI